MSRLKVGVVGATGVLGGELVRLLAQHPEVELSAVCSSRLSGQLLHQTRPALRGAGDLVLRSFDADELARSCELIFLALPHGASGEPAQALIARGLKVIDLGSDFRLRDDDDVRRYYGGEPAAGALRAQAHYGLPELTGGAPSGCHLIANPGCFATALALALTPLAASLTSGAQVQIFGVTGSSGSGAIASDRVHHSYRRTSFTAYKSLRHQHLGEVRQLLAERGQVPHIAFIPHSSALVRGIHITLCCRRDELRAEPGELLHAAYDNSTFVDVQQGEIPLGAVIGSNRALLGYGGDPHQALVFCAIDNLLKGGSGQAVQNMNLLYGFGEDTGLPRLGSWP